MVEHGSPKPLRIFLCHSSGDKKAVRQLYYRLRDENFDPWLDEENLVPGQQWEKEISEAVRNSDIVIVCMSQSSITKAGYVQKEIKFALDVANQQPEGTIFLIPVKLEECEVPARLNQWQWVNLFEDQGYNRLLRALRRRCPSLTSTSSTPGMPISIFPSAAGKVISERSDKAIESSLSVKENGLLKLSRSKVGVSIILIGVAVVVIVLYWRFVYLSRQPDSNGGFASQPIDTKSGPTPMQTATPHQTEVHTPSSNFNKSLGQTNTKIDNNRTPPKRRPTPSKSVREVMP